MPSYKALAACLVAAALLTGCSLADDYFGESEGPPLPGEREAIFDKGSGLIADPEIAHLPVRVPLPAEIDWPVAGGTPDHAGGHRAWGANPQLAWQVSAGTGARDKAQRPLSPPIVAEGRIFVLDSVLNMRALDARTGDTLWAVGTAPEDEEEGFGGGLATNGSTVFMAGGHGQALAVNASDGSLVWRVALPGPVRAAPTLANNLLYVATADNTVLALDITDGRRVWNLPGSQEGASLLGAAAPTVAGDAVVASMSYGDLVALRGANGRELWRASLASVRRFDFGTKLSDISGLPAIADNVLYATSPAGRTAALTMRTGNRIWEVQFGSAASPWVAGNYLYMVSDRAELVCLNREDGRVRWVNPLQRFSDPEDQKGRLTYAGPILAGSQLAIVRSDGVLSMHDPANGAVVGERPIGRRTLLPPVVAGRTLYTLSEDGTLSAFR